MRRVIAGLVLGLILGLTLGLSLPSEADQSSKRIERRLNALEDKTQNLDRNGTISGSNVRAPTTLSGTQCDSGDPAVWRSYVISTYLGC